PFRVDLTRQATATPTTGIGARQTLGWPASTAQVAPKVPSLAPCRAFSSHARAKKLPRAAECLVYSLTSSGVLAENYPKNRGFVGILRGQKCLRRRFSRRSPVGEWSRGARSMPRVFGRGSRSQPAALVSDRDDAALFPPIRILE